MAIAVKIDYTAPSSAISPDGVTFPFNIAAAPLPTGATALANSSGNVAAATATATLTSAVGRTAYLSGFEFMGFGATAATGVVTMTVTGLLGGTLTYFVSVPIGATVAISPFPLAVEFNPPLPASATNTSIVVSMPTLGVGSTNAVMNAHGYLI